jgi:hypothetical protein
MLDAEYIAELTVAYLNGLQNKKTALEAYFERYDKAFEDESRVRSVFQRVLGELQQILPELSKTRWKKKSDFYSLFLVLAENESKLPLAADKRDLARNKLDSFCSTVDAYLNNPAEFPEASEELKEYARGVERAASDFGSRDRRATSLRTVLGPVWADALTPIA